MKRRNFLGWCAAALVAARQVWASFWKRPLPPLSLEGVWIFCYENDTEEEKACLNRFVSEHPNTIGLPANGLPQVFWAQMNRNSVAALCKCVNRADDTELQRQSLNNQRNVT